MTRHSLAAQPPIMSSNPVKRAVARQQLESTVRDFSIRLHLLSDGEYVAADGLASMRVLLVAHELLTQASQADSPAARVIHGAISALLQLERRRWIWRRLDANAVAEGLKHAAEQANAATPGALQLAWATVGRKTAAGPARGAA